MHKITFDGQPIPHQPDENLLQSLIRAHTKPSYSCRAGHCHSCLLQSLSGNIPPQAQTGLTASQREKGLFLACQCLPTGDMDIRRPILKTDKTGVMICGLNKLNHEILELQLSPQTPFRYIPGQHIGLWHGPYLQRRYSLASVPLLDSDLHLHIQRINGGQLSEWLHNHARIGDILQVSAPLGDCCYQPGISNRPLLLVSSGSGLGALYGILRDALQHHHRAPITLFHRGDRAQQLYFQQELTQLARLHDNFDYQPFTGSQTDLQQTITSALSHSDIQRLQAYLCGSPLLVEGVTQSLLALGIKPAQVAADSFFTAAND